MDEALIGLAGIVVGALLGATGTYFRLRRDAWIEARANGLVLLADVCALLAASPTDHVVGDTLLGTKTWDRRGEALVRFRRGNYPSGLNASEWLRLAGHFAQLRELARGLPLCDWKLVKAELTASKELLDCFDFDPPVLPYVIRTGLKEGWKTLVCLLLIVAIVIVLLVALLP